MDNPLIALYIMAGIFIPVALALFALVIYSNNKHRKKPPICIGGFFINNDFGVFPLPSFDQLNGSCQPCGKVGASHGGGCLHAAVGCLQHAQRVE